MGEGEIGGVDGPSVLRGIDFDKGQIELEWNKLAQNPFLAFYQRWPWLCPKYSADQSLETHFCLEQIYLLFTLLFYFVFLQFIFQDGQLKLNFGQLSARSGGSNQAKICASNRKRHPFRDHGSIMSRTTLAVHCIFTF